MKIAFITQNMSFARALIEEFQQYHTVKIYKESRALKWFNMMALIDWCDLAFFDFVGLLRVLSELQYIPKPIVVRAHGLEIIHDHDSIDWKKVSGLVIPPTMLKRIRRMRRIWQKNNPDKKQPSLPRTLQQYVGIDLERIRLNIERPPSYNIILHATVIYEVKRVYTALQCFHELMQQAPDKPWHLTLVGQWHRGWRWPDRKPYVLCVDELIEELIYDFGLKDHLTIKPHNLPWPQWAELLQTQDIYWCMSYRESFGISLAEAGASGAHPLVNHYYGAELVYPPQQLFRSPSELIRKTIAWGQLTDQQKIEKRRDIRNHLNQYDRRRINQEIRLFCEEICEE